MLPKFVGTILVACGVSVLPVACRAQTQPAIRVERDVLFAQVDRAPLRLDLYYPPGIENPPLVVWVHGGAWRSGERADMPLSGLPPEGYAVASVDYRLSPVAQFPAQVHDIKAAIRYLRAHQQELGVDATRIAIAGESAGGHLAALVGVTAGVAELEGDVGGNADQSSGVQAIVDLFGPTNFTTILELSTVHGMGVRIPALQLLLGDQPEDEPVLARLASPVFHVDGGDPPLLMIHGDLDPQVPINQSHELHGRYKALGLPATLEVIHGGAHGGDVFYDEAHTALIKKFLDAHLKQAGS